PLSAEQTQEKSAFAVSKAACHHLRKLCYLHKVTAESAGVSEGRRLGAGLDGAVEDKVRQLPHLSSRRLLEQRRQRQQDPGARQQPLHGEVLAVFDLAAAEAHHHTPRLFRLGRLAVAQTPSQ